MERNGNGENMIELLFWNVIRFGCLVKFCVIRVREVWLFGSVIVCEVIVKGVCGFLDVVMLIVSIV